MIFTDSHAGFLATIRADPDNDAPRLEYADYLEENGEAERAEFIRVQCELARHPQQVEWLEQMPVEQWAGSPEEGRLLRRLESLRHRERELLWESGRQIEQAPGHFISNHYEWGPPDCLREKGGAGGVNWFFRRGFVESIICTPAEWLAHADAILAQQPVREVMLTTWPTYETQGEHGMYHAPHGTSWLMQTWPGVKFTPPSP